jgi:phage tail-like protein
MARGTTSGLPIRHRLGDALPAMFLDDEFVQRFCDGLDEVLAPVPSALDNFTAILSPELTAPDFLDWLGGWVGVDVDRTVPLERQRQMVAKAAILYRRRGTASGLADLVELFIGVRPDVIDGGGVGWSQAPGQVPPGRPGAPLVVRLPMNPPSEVVINRLDALICANKPGHLRHVVEFRPHPPTAVPT